jgi:hypothetical protein
MLVDCKSSTAAVAVHIVQIEFLPVYFGCPWHMHNSIRAQILA